MNHFVQRFWFRIKTRVLYFNSGLLLPLFILIVLPCSTITAFSQNKAVTLNLINTSIKDVLLEIESQTGYYFIYTNEIFDATQRVDIEVQNETVKKVLEDIFKDQDISFEVNDHHIVFSKDEKKETVDPEQQRSVSGKVLDSSGNPLVGVTVFIKGTQTGTITDLDGNYTLPDVPENATIVFSFIGMKRQEFAVSGKDQINVTMQYETIGIEEVVAIGYGTQKKATISGAITSVKGETLEKSPAMNVTNSLAGNLPGLIAVGQSGEPGNDYSTLYIRGRSTLNDNSPLIVVDGIPNRSLERIDPSTIETITVLKDASAAIYGSQAANGVILVTTKRGKEGKYNITATVTTGWSAPTRIPEMTNSAEYATLVNEVNAFDGKAPLYTDEEIAFFASGEDPLNYPNTDWFNAVLKPWSFEEMANLSISGGNEGLKTFLSVSSRFQDGFFENSASKYHQHDFRVNIDKKVNDNFDISMDASMRLEQRSFPAVGSSTIFLNLMSALPTSIARWPTGEPGPIINPKNPTNPVVQVTPDAGTNEGEKYVFNVNSKINYRFPWLQGLTLTATASIDRGLNYSKYFSKLYTLYSWDRMSLDDNGMPDLQAAKYGKSSLTQQLGISKQYLINSFFTYKTKINSVHSINIVTGIEFIQNNYNWFSAQRRNFTQNYPAELDFGDPNEQLASGSNPGTNRWENYFGRFNYSYKEKYNAEIVWRYQGSSKFHPDTRWGFFPGFSVAYRISEENFWKDRRISNFMSYAKLRASWGKTGNDLIPPYQFYSLYDLYWQSFVTGDDVYHPVYRESLAGNSKAQWEEAQQLDLGIDLNMLDSRLMITADYFNDLRTKILIEQTASVPQMTGTTGKLPKINLGEVSNQGFDFQITWRDKIGRLNYSVGVNGVHAKNKVLFFDEAEGALDWQKQTGFPMHAGLYYEAIGIFRSAEDLENYPHFDEARIGDVIFKDVNEDGMISGDDMIRIFKNSVPTLTGGLTISLSYKNFDFTSLFQGQAGAVRYVQYRGAVGEQNYFKNFYDNRWTESNSDASYPRTFNRNDEYWVSSGNKNTFWLRKTDFIRLKNLEFGYNVPNSYSNKIGLSDVRFSVGGMNLFTYCPDMKDFDPELEPKGNGFAGEGYPLQKIIKASLTVKF